MHRGYYKRWRKERDSEIWDMPPLYLRTWDWILREVDYITGEMTTSLSQIAEGVEWWERKALRRPSKRTVSEILSWLVEHKMIGAEICGVGNAKYTKVSIVNWETYQSADNEVVNAQKTQGKRTSHRLEESLKTPPCPPPPPLGAHTREGEDLGEELEGEKPETTNSQTTLAFRFSRMPTGEQRTEAKRAGFAYDGHGSWSAPWSPARQALVDRLRPYLASDAPTVPPATAPATTPPPARPLATGAATGAQGAAPEPAPITLPATPPHLQPVLGWLQGHLRPQSYSTWFAPSALAGTAEHLEVLTISPIITRHIEDCYLPLLQQACQDALGRAPATVADIKVRVPGAAARASPPGGPPPGPATEPAAESAP